jgi:nicotinamide/nicotinate riboside kinase
MDWDCSGALVIPDIAKALDHIQQNGTMPVSDRPMHATSYLPWSSNDLSSSQPEFDSKEDRNSVGQCPVPDEIIAALKSQVKDWTKSHDILTKTKLCVFDGFLLYSESMEEIQKHMDLKLFLRVSYEKAKARREARDGYATIEGFWHDPPGLVLDSRFDKFLV